MKRLCYISALVIVLSFLAGSCIESFVPEIPASSGELVVEGYISDVAEPYIIHLSRSRPLDAENAVPETGASVAIIGEEGEELTLVEVSPGRYSNDSGSFVGQVGRRYTLDIVTAGGQHYQSQAEVLRETPPIDSVHFVGETRFTDVANVLVSGIKIMVDTHDPTNSSRYYKWDWVENWEVKAPYPNAYFWEPGDRITWPGRPYTNPDPHVFCYNSDTSRQVLIESTNNLAEDEVRSFEVKFTSTTDFKLTSHYSILLKQYVISESAFRYWGELQRLNESQGTLFDPQPYALPGNVFSMDNPDEVVLGYFEARSVREKRLFVKREELRDLDFPFNQCYHERKDSVNYWNVQDLLDQGYVIYGAGGFDVEFVHMIPRDCADCTYHGVLEKPEFFP